MRSEPVEVVIERIVAGGYGLARTAEGTVLVRGGLPGERVTARPAMKAGVLRAHAIDIVEAHPSRLVDPLPPGADLPLAYDDQLPIKQNLVEEALTRIGKVDAAVDPIRPSPRTIGYRTAAQYAVVEAGGLGARAVDSDRVVPLERDPLVCEPVATAFALCAQRPLQGLREISFRASLHEKRALVALHGGAVKHAERIARALEDSGVAGVVWAEVDARGRFRGKAHTIVGEDRMLEDFGGVLASVSVQSFAQVNPLAAGELYRDAAQLAGSGERALDVYAGSGVFALHLAPTFREVTAVEISTEAVRRGQADARRLGRHNLRFERGDVRAARRFLPADVVVMDPPRAGVERAVIDALLEHRPRKVVYVSCDPTTWARDVGMLVTGGYTLRVARPYDFYPFTHHTEVLSLLEL